jgi:hypothetical protein
MPSLLNNKVALANLRCISTQRVSHYRFKFEVRWKSAVRF